MTGSYLTRDAGRTWHIFNLGAPAKFFVFDPIDPHIVYAYADALFRSADGGDTWSRFHPRASAIQRITTGDDHGMALLHYSGDPQGEITALAVDPDDSQSLIAGVLNSGKASLWQSVDGGGGWRKIADISGRASHIWIDAHSLREDRTLYVAGPNGILIRQDGRWRTGQSPGAITTVSGAWPQSGSPVFYAISVNNIVVSPDGGSTWRKSSLPGYQGVVRTVAASPTHPEIAYASYSHLRAPIRQSFGVAKTVDYGRHWDLVWQEGPEPVTNIRDAWISERFGSGWGGNPRGLAVAPGDPNVSYGTDDGRVMRTTDGGKTWTGVYSLRRPDGNWTTNGLDVTSCYGVHFDPFDARHMFISYTDIGLWASDNGGESWYSATLHGVPQSWTNTTYWLEFDPKVKGRMWAAMSTTHDLPRPKMWRNRSPETYDGGVMRTDDGGRTWHVQNQGMPPTAATHILRLADGTLFVAGFGRGVFQSTDGGEHWTLKNNGIEGAQPFAWRLAAASNGTLYLVVARRSDDGSFGNTGDGAVYRSIDHTEHWTRVQLPQGVNGPNGLAIDPGDAKRLYLAAWGRTTREGALDGGIYLSTDAGTTWRRVLAEDQHIYDVTIDWKDPRVLYATGFEQAVWRSGDRGVSWTNVPGFDFRWGHRVIVHPEDHTRIYVTTFGGSVWTK